MKIMGLHNQKRELAKKRGSSAKQSGKVLKSFPNAGRVAVLLSDGTTQLVQTDKPVLSGETLYFDELALLGEYQPPSKDATDLLKDKPLSSADVIVALTSLKEESSITPLIKELAAFLKKGVLTKEVQQKVKAIIQKITADVSLFAESGSIKEPLGDSLPALKALLQQSDSKLALPLLDKITTLEHTLVSLLVEDSVQKTNQNFGSSLAPDLLKAVVQSAINSGVVDELSLDRALFTKLSAEDIQQKILPAVSKEQPQLRSLISLLQQQPVVQDDLFVLPAPKGGTPLPEVAHSTHQVVPDASALTTQAPILLGTDFAFTSLYSTLKQEFSILADHVPAEQLTEMLMQGKGVDREALQILQSEVALSNEAYPQSKENISSALIKSLSFLTEGVKAPSISRIKEIYNFHLYGGKEMPVQVSSLYKEVQEFLQQPVVTLSSLQEETFQGVVTALAQYDELLSEPAMSTLLKKEGLSALLSQLGILPSRSESGAPQPRMSLKSVVEKMFSGIRTLEQQLQDLGSDKEKEKEQLREVISGLRKKSREIAKSITTISLMAKPVEKGPQLEQTFYLPVQVGGEEVAVQLKVRREKGSDRKKGGAIDGTQVEISMELKKLGLIESRLQLTKNNSLSVALTSGKAPVVQWFRDHLREMYKSLEESNLTSVSLIIDGVKPFQERTTSIKKSRIEFTG